MAAGDSGAGGLAAAFSVYRHYDRLIRVDAGGLGGRWLLTQSAAYGASQADPGALVRAANIAGAATLLIAGDHAAARDRVRSGVCDFLVTHLDEALRILKNELRRRLPVAVCLLGEADEVARECVIRGVQPDIFVPLEDAAASAQVFEERGALAIPWIPEGGQLEAEKCLGIVAWTTHAQRGEALAALDALALASVGPSLGPDRRRWLDRAPQYLSRVLGPRAGATHTLPMDEQEAARFSAAVTRAIADERLPESVVITSAPAVALQSAATE